LSRRCRLRGGQLVYCGFVVVVEHMLGVMCLTELSGEFESIS